MRRLLFCLMLAGALPAAHAHLRIFACEPEWAALATAIGGANVDVSSATTALQDPHYIQARPSLIARVRRADLVVCSGSQLEIGWLPMLLTKANNPKVQPGSPGFLETSALVVRLEVPASVDRSLGDMHPQGNPHVQLNPRNVAAIARALSERMAALDPEGGYEAGLADFLPRWNAAAEVWQERARPLNGKRIIVHHKSWAYLEDWLGLEEVAQLEPVPGVPPTASHLSELLARLGRDGEGADFIVRAPFQDQKPSAWLSQRTGIPELMLPLTVGGSDGADDLFGLFDDILDRLLGAES